GVREVVAQHGLFCSLYTDRGSHYFETPEAGARVSKTVLTQCPEAARHRAHRRKVADASPWHGMGEHRMIWSWNTPRPARGRCPHK
ncbi:MAG: hypothetical protein WAL10_08850, partial [Acetobacteraceae bacterium]